LPEALGTSIERSRSESLELNFPYFPGQLLKAFREHKSYHNPARRVSAILLIEMPFNVARKRFCINRTYLLHER
jgi:hypothetical protein